jgi:hypothetical protein
LEKNPGNLKKPMGMGKMGKTGKIAFFSKHMFKKHFKTLANK